MGICLATARGLSPPSAWGPGSTFGMLCVGGVLHVFILSLSKCLLSLNVDCSGRALALKSERPGLDLTFDASSYVPL